MGAKFKTIILTVLITFVGFMFSGCDTWSSNYSNTQPPITSGTHPKDTTKDPNFDESNEDLVKDEGKVDESALYDFLAGIKFAYDGTQHKLDTIASPRFQATYAKVDNYLKTHQTIDCKAFATENNELQVDATFVSRTVWVYNYVNQYRALANIILTKYAQVYGYGIADGYSISNNLYGTLNFETNSVEVDENFVGNKGAINAGVYQTTNTFETDNPYYGLGEATFGGVNFNDVSVISFDLGKAVPSKAYKFALNLSTDDAQFVMTAVNPYYDPSNIVNQPTIPDPDDSTQTIANPNYIPNHILGKSELSFVGIMDASGSISYTLATGSVTVPEANEFASAYAEKFSDYLALRLLEAHLQASNTYDGEYNNVYLGNFLSHYDAWTQQVNKFGFDEQARTADGTAFTLADAVLDAVATYVVGLDTLDADDSAGAYSRDLRNMTAQIVADSLSAKTTKSEDGSFYFDSENGTPYFVTVYNIEYKDYSTEELFGVANAEDTPSESARAGEGGDSAGDASAEEDDIRFFADEVIYSAVIMLKPDYEPVVMQSICLLMLAPYCDVDVELAFRYVKNGEQIINSKIDYSIKNEATDDDEYVINNEFEGHLEKYDGQELTMEFADKCIFALEDYNTPGIDKLKNKEVLLEAFKNNLASDFASALFASDGDARYAYDAEKGTYYYNDVATGCDYVELNFVTTARADGSSEPAGSALSRLRLGFFALYFDTLSNLQETQTA